MIERGVIEEVDVIGPFGQMKFTCSSLRAGGEGREVDRHMNLVALFMTLKSVATCPNCRSLQKNYRTSYQLTASPVFFVGLLWTVVGCVSCLSVSRFNYHLQLRFQSPVTLHISHLNLTGNLRTICEESV